MPRSLADLVFGRFCPSLAPLCGPTAGCWMVLRHCLYFSAREASSQTPARPRAVLSSTSAWILLTSVLEAESACRAGRETRPRIPHAAHRCLCVGKQEANLQS